MGLSEFIEARENNKRKLQLLGINPYPYSFNKTISCNNAKEAVIAGSKETFSTSGRVMAKRVFGKLAFFDLQDESGKIQVVANGKILSGEQYGLVELIDIGDIIGAVGTAYITKSNEPSIQATQLVMLAKAMLPLPDSWNGLKNIETRYRNRHIDMIMNDNVRKTLWYRSRIISLVRQFLDERGFLEMETPLLQPIYGGANAQPFKTYSNALETEQFLSISSELYLKRYIVGGFDRVYTICKNFRNEDIDRTHNPEFTMLECYAAYWDYNNMMDFTEKLFEFIAISLYGTTTIVYQGTKIELQAPWKRMTMAQALRAKTGLNIEEFSDGQIQDLLNQNNLELENYNRGLAIVELFEFYCEKELIQPVFIIDHPKETTPLCKLHRSNPSLIERFEPYINGCEMANAYTELNDPIVQRQFFEEQANNGRAKGENHPIDLDFVNVLMQGMPPTAGLGIGIDRLVMLFANQPTISDVIGFPQLKPLK
jgi:lysyl-tRNA synthetase class 2